MEVKNPNTQLSSGPDYYRVDLKTWALQQEHCRLLCSRDARKLFRGRSALVVEPGIEVLLWMSVLAECSCRADWRSCLTACAVGETARTPRLMLDSG